MGELLNFPNAARMTTRPAATANYPAACQCHCGTSGPAIQVTVENCRVEVGPGAALEVLYAQLKSLRRFRR